jgi:hypothetical protein
MKKILVAVAMMLGIAAAPAALAGIDLYVDIGMSRPMVVTPVTPVIYYRHAAPRWQRGHDRFDRHYGPRGRHEFARHHGWR